MRQLLTIILLLVSHSNAAAWGVEGHKIVAIIAERHLTLEALQAVGVLLSEEGKSSMVEVANWADGVRHLMIPVQPSHSVQLKGGSQPYDISEDCPRRNCILAAISADIDVLRNSALRVESKVMALKYLIHFVADLHMPMHATEAGRGLEVMFRNRKITLHKVWDTLIISSRNGDVYKIASEVEQSTVVYQPEKFLPIEWAIEGRDITRDIILVGPLAVSRELVELPDDYADDNWPVVQERLHIAGLRLAHLLNDIFTNMEERPAADESEAD